MKKSDNFNAIQWLTENKITTQSKLKENKIQGVDVKVDDYPYSNHQYGDMVTLSGDSGDYDGFIEDNGTISFSVVYDDLDEEFNDQNWKDILGDDHVFVKIANAINTDVEAIDDYVQITVKADDLTSMNESRLNENNIEASELLSLLASPEIKKYMDKLSDTLEDADFMRVKKLYDGLYTELKKHE